MNVLNKAIETIVIIGIAIGITVAITMTVQAEEVSPYREIIMSASDNDINDLEQVVYWESARADTPIETNMAVVETVLNRILDDSGYFPKEISKVIRQKRQFSTVKKFSSESIPEMKYEEICDSICEVINSNTTILPSKDYVYFDTKKWDWGKDWIWIGKTDINGNPIEGKGMWFGRCK